MDYPEKKPTSMNAQLGQQSASTPHVGDYEIAARKAQQTRFTTFDDGHGRALNLLLPSAQKEPSQISETKAPTTLAHNMSAAALTLEDNRGDITKFVANELGFKINHVLEVFRPEQITDIGLAIDAHSKGYAMINSDMTKPNTGRFAAAMILYAKKRGMNPIFVTPHQCLYESIAADLTNIRAHESTALNGRMLRGIMTDNTDDGTLGQADHSHVQIVHMGSKTHENMIQDMAQKLDADPDAGLGEFDFVVTTYSQMNPASNKPILTEKLPEESRHRLVRAAAVHGMLIMSELHNANASEDSGMEENAWAGFFHDLIQSQTPALKSATRDAGQVFTSSVFAESAEDICLYQHTLLGDSFGQDIHNPDQVREILVAGGNPLQNWMAAQLALAGQYVYREHSWDDVVIITKKVAVDTDAYGVIAELLRSICSLDECLQPLRKQKQLEIANMNGITNVGSTSMGTFSFNMRSVTLMTQFLLAMKIEEAVHLTLQEIAAGHKPVLTLANTTGTFIEEVTEDLHISDVETFDLCASDVVRRYLWKTREYSVDVQGQPLKNLPNERTGKPSETGWLTDQDIGQELVQKYNRIVDEISATEVLSQLPASPIDYLLWKLRETGIRVDEITDRGVVLDYQGDNAVELKACRNDTAMKNQIQHDYNSGQLDVLIINQSGSSNVSLHSGENFLDQRPRTMILVQPELVRPDLEVNTQIQLFEHINQIGQVNKPSYIIMEATIPVEERLLAIVRAKFQTLNALLEKCG